MFWYQAFWCLHSFRGLKVGEFEKSIWLGIIESSFRVDLSNNIYYWIVPLSITMKNDFSHMFRCIFRHEGGIFRQNVITDWKKFGFWAFQWYVAHVSRFKFALSGRSQRLTSFWFTWASFWFTWASKALLWKMIFHLCLDAFFGLKKGVFDTMS